MGTSQAKKHLQKAIESDNLEYTVEVLKQFPMLIEESLYKHSTITPLQRASWRGCIDIVMHLCELGADVNKPDSEGLTPLMWASKRDYPNICVTLHRFGAALNKRSREGFTALDYAILQGNYSSAYILYEFDKHLQEPLSYETIRLMKQWRYVDYPLFIDCLKNGIQPQSVPDFLTKPLKQEFNDPVIDPRESWRDMFKRVMRFDPPPLCERNELPPELQPQNRLLGRLNSYINGLDPIPHDYELEQVSHGQLQQIHSTEP